MEEKLASSKILGVKVTTASEEKILEYLTRRLENSGKNDGKFYITTPNPEIIVYAQSHPEFKKILNEAEIALPDGVGVVIAGKLLGVPIRGRIAGSDMVKKVCGKVSNRPITTGFFGGLGGVANTTAECLAKKYPGLRINYAGSEWKPEAVRGQIDLLFVALGFPKQEEWIKNNLEKLPVKSAMGVGGSFDFLSGRVPRAPKLIQDLYLEWLFRLFIQPWRIKRQLALLSFAYLILKEKLTKKSSLS